MKFQKMPQSFTIPIHIFLIIIYLYEAESAGFLDSDFDFSDKSSPLGSGSTGFTFPILKKPAIIQTSPVGRAFVDPKNSTPQKKGWLKFKGRGVTGEEGNENLEASGSKETTSAPGSQELTLPSGSPEPSLSSGSQEPIKLTPKVKHITSFTFTDDKNEGYDKIIDEAKEEVQDQREMENSNLENDELIAAQGGALGDSPGPILRSGLKTLYEVHPNKVPSTDIVEYLKDLKRAFALKNHEEMERFKKRRQLMTLMEKEGMLDESHSYF